ncbi:hypothetical protein [Streptomyces sp. NPDC059816]|uniref:hypothetical protein n=1 Tax=Streptomyces sp. NPDC059816 TaxID=3346960 RepID=UPI0036625134
MLPEELPALKGSVEKKGLLLMMAELAPVWSEDYQRLAPMALRYLQKGLPPNWARDLEAGTD